MTTNASSPFYITGGTLPRESSSYVTRRADTELYEGLRAGEYCYVLNARQMGKSSLCVRTIARLQADGIKTVFIDLTRFGGKNLSAEQWYAGLLAEIGRELGLRAEFLAHWKARQELGPMQRLFETLREVGLERCPEPIVILIDEIDIARSLPFSTDEFFAAIRECYNSRVQEPEYARLTFCLLGVAAPSELISDPQTTPFNIGRRVELRDFTRREAQPLASGLQSLSAGSQPQSVRLSSRRSQQVFDRIFYWTNGHPYLTQVLFKAVTGVEATPLASAARGRGHGTPGEVDKLCHELFLSTRARNSEDNLAFARNHLLKGDVDTTALLELYERVLRGRQVADDPTNPLVERLKLAGVARSEQGRLRVRNRIYRQVFNRAWVRENMPGDELRRQGRAFRRGVRLTLGALGGVTLIGLIAFGLWRSSLEAEPQIEIPAVKITPNQDAYDNFVAASKSLTKESRSFVLVNKKGQIYRTDEKTGKEIIYTRRETEALLRANTDALIGFRQGLKFAYQEPQYRSFDTMFPQYAAFRALARVLRVEERARADRGDLTGAAESGLDIMDLGCRVQHSASMLGRLVGLACQDIGRRDLWTWAEKLHASEARRAARRMEGIEAASTPLAEVMEEEKWAQLAGLIEVYRSPDWRAKLLNSWKEAGPVERQFDEARIRTMRWDLWFAGKQDCLESYTRYLGQSIAYVSQPYAAHSAPPAVPQNVVGTILTENTNGDGVSVLNTWCKDVGCRALNELIIAKLALRAYQQEHAAYPDTLQELVKAGILARVPMDSFALNAPLRYQRRGTGYALYSVGPDGKDDGGIPLHAKTPPTQEPGAEPQTIKRNVEPTDMGDVVAE